MLDVEGEWIAHRPPADRRRARSGDAIATGIQERHARPAHEPLQRAADQEVDPGIVHVEPQRADRLVGVHHERRTLAVADVGERLHVLDVSARVVDVAGADECGAVVDRALEELERHGAAVRAVDEFHLDAGLREGEPGVSVGREVDVGDDHLVALGVVER